MVLICFRVPAAGGSKSVPDDQGPEWRTFHIESKYTAAHADSPDHSNAVVGIRDRIRTLRARVGTLPVGLLRCRTRQQLLLRGLLVLYLRGFRSVGAGRASNHNRLGASRDPGRLAVCCRAVTRDDLVQRQHRGCAARAYATRRDALGLESERGGLDSLPRLERTGCPHPAEGRRLLGTAIEGMAKRVAEYLGIHRIRSLRDRIVRLARREHVGPEHGQYRNLCRRNILPAGIRSIPRKEQPSGYFYGRSSLNAPRRARNIEEFAEVGEIADLRCYAHSIKFSNYCGMVS